MLMMLAPQGVLLGRVPGPRTDRCFVDSYGRAMRADLAGFAKAFPSLSGQWLGGLSTVSNTGWDIKKLCNG